MVSVILRNVTDRTASLVKRIDNLVGQDKGGKLGGFVVLLASDVEASAAALAALARKHQVTRVPLTVYAGVDGPPKYSIAADAEVTVMLWGGEKKLVRANFAFRKNGLDKSAVAAILRRVSDMAGKQARVNDNDTIAVPKAREAVALLEKINAAIEIDKQGRVIRVGVFNTRMSASQLARLGTLTDIETLDLQDATITAAGLKQLEGLTNLRSLNLFRNKRLTDAGVQTLCRMKELENLNISSTQISNVGLEKLLVQLTALKSLNIRNSKTITDAGLVHLKQNPNLQRLYVGNTMFTDIGMEHIAKLKNLIELELRRTKIRNDGLRHIGKLTSLVKLNVSDNNITSDGVRHLTRLTKLRSLELSQTRIDDSVIDHLRRLVRLESLDLSRTRITGAAVAKLQSLRKLKFVNLFETGVTEKEVATLRKALPGCEILH